MHLLVQCGEKPDWLKLRQTVHDYCYSVIPGPIAMDVGAITKGRGKGKTQGQTSHTVVAARARKARRANRRRMQRSPRITISSTVIAGVVEDGDTDRKTVGCANRKGHQVNHVSKDDTGSIMLSTSADILFITQRISPDGIDARSDCPLWP